MIGAYHFCKYLKSIFSTCLSWLFLIHHSLISLYYKMLYMVIDMIRSISLFSAACLNLLQSLSWYFVSITSYRPIFFLSTLAKLVENLNMSRIIDVADCLSVVPEKQFAFSHVPGSKNSKGHFRGLQPTNEYHHTVTGHGVCLSHGLEYRSDPEASSYSSIPKSHSFLCSIVY